MKLTKSEENLDLGLNMTPMIDIVFQLIIFFMVVTELATLDLERLNLPYASQTDTETEISPGETWVTINVTRETDENPSEVKIKRRRYTQAELEEFLSFEAKMAGQDPNEFAPEKMISRLFVLVRADREARYEAIERVMQACQKNGIWKTSVATTEEKDTQRPGGL
jgi:biopolymer transport protein ExbD